MQITELSEAVGKTLTAVVMSQWDDAGSCLLVFDDDTLSQIGVDRGWDNGVAAADNLEFDADCYDLDELKAAGVIDDEWIQQRQRAAQERERLTVQEREHEEYRRYERLKRKFEPRKQESQ